MATSDVENVINEINHKNEINNRNEIRRDEFYHQNGIDHQNGINRHQITSSNASTPLSREMHSAFSKYINSNISTSNLLWDDENEAVIKCYAEKAQGYQFIYGKCYYYYRNLYLWISIPLGILMVVLSSTQTFLMTLKQGYPQIDDNILQIVTAIMTYAVAILSAIYVKFNFEIKIKGCKDVVKICNSYESDMRTLLSLPVEMRINPLTAIKNAAIDYEKISNIENEIQVPQDILESYKTAFENKCKLFDV